VRNPKSKSPRAAIGKSLRFDIFNRDGFACQYCGHKPPDVLLVLDHIIPVARGGGNEELNLTTSCAECNSGKAAKVLTDIRPAPDADYHYLQSEQQRLEYERYLESKTKRDLAESQVVQIILNHWSATFGGSYVPTDEQVRSWLKYYRPELIERAISACYPAYQQGKIRERWFDDMLRYIGATMRNMRNSEDARHA